jgi:CheY-like chemotaxis protein
LLYQRRNEAKARLEELAEAEDHDEGVAIADSEQMGYGTPISLTPPKKRKRINTVVSCDGRQAVDHLKKDLEACQVVFMDNLMPILNGMDAARELRALGYRHLIIGCTGNVLEDDMREFLKAGADMMLPKPMKINQLYMILSYVRTHGTLSIPGMKLKEVNNNLVWVPFLY